MTDREIAIAALGRLHELKVAFNFTRLIMNDDARHDAGEMVKDVEEFIEEHRSKLSVK